MKAFIFCIAFIATSMSAASTGPEYFDYSCKYISPEGKVVFDTYCSVEVVSFGAYADVQYSFSFTSKSSVNIYKAMTGQSRVNGLAATVVEVENGIVAVTLEGTGVGEAFVLTYK